MLQRADMVCTLCQDPRADLRDVVKRAESLLKRVPPAGRK